MREASGEYRKYFSGQGIDIGGAPDPLETGMGEVVVWDKNQGDAEKMAGVADATFDFVYSSHLLEHVGNPVTAIRNWVRICKPGGHIFVAVPDFELYEKKRIPSIFNRDHKHFFSLRKFNRVICVPDWLESFAGVEIVLVRLNDVGYDHDAPVKQDQTRGMACAQIEFVLRKNM